MTHWTITLTPAGDGPPVDQRIRALLKVSLRRFGLRAVDVREGTPPHSNADARDGFGMTREASGRTAAPESTASRRIGYAPATPPATSTNAHAPHGALVTGARRENSQREER